MIIREGIEVTGITLDGYELPISEGFSDFLLREGYWRIGEEVETINYDEVVSWKTESYIPNLFIREIKRKEVKSHE